MAVPRRAQSFFSFFPTPEFLLLSTAGIAIKDKGVRFVQFKSLKLSSWGTAPLPIGVVESGFITDPASVSSVLKEMAVAHKINYVRATLPDEKAYLFTTVIDKVPPESLRDAVAFIIEENAPVSLPESVFDFQVVDANHPSGIKVTVAVVTKKVIEAYQDVFHAAGITPISFDIESQAIARAVIPEGDARTTLIVSLGESKASFYIVENEVVQLSTTPAQDVLAKGAPINPQDLRNELRKVLTFWSSKVDARGQAEKKIERAIVCGTGAENITLINEIMSECPVEYSLADAWTNAKAASKKAPIAEVPEYLSAIGAALPVKKRRMYKMLTDEERGVVSSAYHSRRSAVMLGALMAVLAIGLIGLFPSYMLAELRYKDASNQLKMIGNLEPSAEEAALHEWLSDFNLKLRTLSQRENVRNATPSIGELIKIKDSQIKFTSLVWSLDKGKPTLSVTGVATSREDLITFENTLNKDGRWGEVSIPISNLAKDKDIDFQVKLTPTI
ncbi:pilus assembly protein PilM [Candidatus Parcubacteria bacterium]|nr:pilus assembly protein PilM [Candidatus Parcubacteria bacterium]